MYTNIENENDDDEFDENEFEINDDDEENFNELISHQYSRRRSNQIRNVNLAKLKYNKINQTNQNPNKHDLSSNTLSVDSGLSVPTATNSDPESEKSAINNKNFEEKLKIEIDNLKNFYLTTNEFTESIDGTLTKYQPQLLKRQRRMLILKQDSDECLEENHFSYSATLKPMAPVAPDTDILLIPYNTDTMPSHYQKSPTQPSESNKKIAPNVNDLINQTSALTLNNNFDCLISSALNKSSTNSELKVNKNSRKPLVKVDLIMDNLNNNLNNFVSSGYGLTALNDLDFYSQNEQWLNQSESIDSNQSDKKISTDIFIKLPTSPTLSLTSSNSDKLVNNKRTNSYKIAQNQQQQRRKLSKTLKDYKPSKHFVENLNGFQPIKKASSSSSGADIEDDLDDLQRKIKINRKLDLTRSTSSQVAFKKQAAKRSSSIQVNNSLKASSIMIQPQNQNQKEIRRSISLKNKFDSNDLKQMKTKLQNSESSAFKPVVLKKDTIKNNLVKKNIQINIPLRNNSTVSVPKRAVQNLNSNSVSSMSSVSLSSSARAKNVVEVTWSVSNIKKKFENNSNNEKSMKKTDDQCVYLHGFKDSNGNTITYI